MRANELDAIEERLDARRAREWGLARLGELFKSGELPDPHPDGFLLGHPLAFCPSGAIDMWGRRLAELHMPWLGKRFGASTNEGVNVLTPLAGRVLRVVMPGFEPERELADRIEAFPFRTEAGPGALDGQTRVLKIDYNWPRNSVSFVRRILDEIVQLDTGLYLGKALMRGRNNAWRELAYFSLSSRPSV